jgi:hypothetical protein
MKDDKAESWDTWSSMFGHGGGGVPIVGEAFDNFLKTFNNLHDATSQLNDLMKPYINNDTMGWFLNSDGRSSDLRGLPKDSPHLVVASRYDHFM